MRKAASFVSVALLVLMASFLSHGTVSVEQVDQGFDAPPAWSPVPFPFPPATCGDNVCGPGTYCCNPSCGTCTPFGAYCTQQVCNPTS